MKGTKKEITKENLEKIYKENSVEDAAKEVGLSTTALYEYLERFHIPLKGRKGNQKFKLKVIA